MLLRENGHTDPVNPRAGQEQAQPVRPQLKIASLAPYMAEIEVPPSARRNAAR